MAEDDELSTRYAFLLQPIRDLQKNWDIDISHLLEEFVERIRELSDQSGFDDEGTGREDKFNFAEAAILIQGSTMVYGKKVEYVHGLARDFYEQLRDKKTSRKRNSGDNMEHVEDDVDEFAQEPDDPCELLQFTNLRTVDWKTLMLKSEAKPPPLLAQMPISLMPLADFEKTNVPLYSSRNLKELIGKRDDFIINTGFIHKSGALLLDLANAKLLNDFMMQKHCHGSLGHADVLMQQDDGQSDVADNEHIRSSTSEVEKIRRMTSGTNLNTITRRDTSHVQLVSDVDIGANMVKDDAGKNYVQEENDETGDFGFDRPPVSDVEDDKDDGHHPADEEVFDEADEDEPVMDLFRLQKCKHAPYRACKPSFVPEQIEKRRLKRREKLGLKTCSTLNDFLQRHIYHSLPKGTAHALDDDFSIIFGKLIRNLEKHRMNAIKERALQNVGLYQQSDDVQSGESEVEVDEYAGADNGYSDDEIEGAVDITGDGNLTFANMPNDVLEDRVHVSSMYMNLNDPDLLLKPAEQMTYQDLLKRYTCRYWSSAEETTSKLCKRVQQWEEKVQPLLEEEETRREFNIHQYSTELLDQYEGIGQTRTFAELMQNVRTRYDISRYCLASLMLANTGNIEVDFGSNTESVKDGRDLALKLLKKERHHQQFSEFHALST
uniref:Condensin-2 complex subunit H2 n=1 Tax=Elaeophora elaphi TaxID=1147741 RepID=A0A0R3RVE6_9BILA